MVRDKHLICFYAFLFVCVFSSSILGAPVPLEEAFANPPERFSSAQAFIDYYNPERVEGFTVDSGNSPNIEAIAASAAAITSPDRRREALNLVLVTPNDQFGRSYQDTYSNAINWLSQADLSKFLCQNEALNLCNSSPWHH